jgi:hypothetical protein
VSVIRAVAWRKRHNNLARTASPFFKRRSRSLLKSTQKEVNYREVVFEDIK